jgi:hypothetical protein
MDKEGKEERNKCKEHTKLQNPLLRIDQRGRTKLNKVR